MCTKECPHVTAMRSAYLDRIRMHKVYLASLRRTLTADIPGNVKVDEVRAWYNRFAASLTDCAPINPETF